MGVFSCNKTGFVGPGHISDRVCENQSYLHIKFDLILSLSNLITLFPNIVLYQKFLVYTKFPKEFNKTYRYCITHTEKEIDMIK